MLQFVIRLGIGIARNRTWFRCWYDKSHTTLTNDPDLKREQCVKQSWLLIKDEFIICTEQCQVNLWISFQTVWPYSLEKIGSTDYCVSLCTLTGFRNYFDFGVIARTAMRSNIHLGTNDNNKKMTYDIQNVESLVRFSPTGTAKKWFTRLKLY